ASVAPAVGSVRVSRSAAGQPAVRKQALIIRLSAAGHRVVMQSNVSRSGALASGDVTGSMSQARVVLLAVSLRTLVPSCLSSATHVPHGPAVVHLILIDDPPCPLSRSSLDRHLVQVGTGVVPIVSSPGEAASGSAGVQPDEEYPGRRRTERCQGSGDTPLSL